MLNYFKKNFITKNQLLENGDCEILFLDQSKYVGDIQENVLSGEGIFYIQQVGVFEGTFFKNSFHKGTLSFKDICILNGNFYENEQFEKGFIKFPKNDLEIEIETKFNKISVIKFIEDNEEIQFDIVEKQRSYKFQNGFTLILDDNLTCISLQKEYSNGLFTGNRILVDLENLIFEEQNYLQGKKYGINNKLCLHDVPYYQEYEYGKEDENDPPKYKTIAANGNVYNGNFSFEQGIVKSQTENFTFKGGIKGAFKHGKGLLSFEDGCFKNIEFINDKVAFKKLSDVFKFVSDFKCFNHPDIMISNDLMMIKFMDEVKSFNGFIQDGTTPEKVEIVFKNGDEYKGKIENFQKQGYGVYKKGDRRIIGDFSEDQITYGIIEYASGATYEGEILDLERSGKGLMIYSNGFNFTGEYLADIIIQKGGQLQFEDDPEIDVYYLHISEFDIGVFIEKVQKQLYLLNCNDQSVHDSKLIDKLKQSGIDIRQSLRKIKAFNE